MSAFTIGDLSVKPGERAYGKLGTFYLSDGTAVSLPLMVVRGEQDGPVLWISAGMHGQEMSGIPVIWEIIKERHNLNEDHLNEKLYQIDMRDGQLDGKNQRSEPIKCPKCKRPVSSRHPACIYCGHEIDDSVFRMS